LVAVAGCYWYTYTSPVNKSFSDLNQPLLEKEHELTERKRGVGVGAFSSM
jgi:hypothetical protein